jgi:hypothetical protein
MEDFWQRRVLVMTNSFKLALWTLGISVTLTFTASTNGWALPPQKPNSTALCGCLCTDTAGHIQAKYFNWTGTRADCKLYDDAACSGNDEAHGTAFNGNLSHCDVVVVQTVPPGEPSPPRPSGPGGLENK